MSACVIFILHQKIQKMAKLLVPAHPDCPRQSPESCKVVVFCCVVYVYNRHHCTIVLVLQDMQGMGMNGSGASQVAFRLVVPNPNCGSLIGKGGNNIRELREVSVYVTVVHCIPGKVTHKYNLFQFHFTTISVVPCLMISHGFWPTVLSVEPLVQCVVCCL